MSLIQTQLAPIFPELVKSNDMRIIYVVVLVRRNYRLVIPP